MKLELAKRGIKYFELKKKFKKINYTIEEFENLDTCKAIHLEFQNRICLERKNKLYKPRNGLKLLNTNNLEFLLAKLMLDGYIFDGINSAKYISKNVLFKIENQFILYFNNEIFNCPDLKSVYLKI